MRASVQRGRAANAWGAAILLACAVGLPSAARLQDKNDATKKEIQTVLDQCWKCVAAKDLEGYSKNLAEDYRRIDYFGETTDREKTVAYLKTLTEPVESIDSTATVEALNVKDNEATVLVRVKGKATAKDADGKVIPVRWDQRETQVWTKTADGWRLRDSMGLTESVFLDDKPYTPETTDEAAAARTAIQSVYNALARAIVEGDAEGFAKLIPSSFVIHPTQGGTAQSRDEFLTNMKRQFERKGGTAKFKLERAMLSGDKATVLGSLMLEHTEMIEGTPTKTTTTIWQRDIWRKTDKGWEPVEFRPLLQERTVGGKIGAAIFASPGPRA
jgi:ketosteroid isomerase-like protein